MLGADPARLAEFGRQMRRRRSGSPPAGLGYRHMPAFTQDRGINSRLAGDVEKGRRDTYTFPSLEDIARAYGVTYDSMLNVVWSGAGELVPAGPRALPSAPQDDDAGQPGWPPERVAANRRYYDEINERRFALAAQGIIDPTGEQMFPGAPDDAKAWDGIGRRLPVGDRVWFIADLRRWEAGRVPNSGADAAGA